ncbi:MAG: hypothetical protein ACR2QC_04045 [Gammaproteobacteria bacterium]
MKHFATICILILGLTGCKTFYGEAETPQREAWRAMARYVYVATPGQNYAEIQGAEPGVLAALCAADQSVYDAYQGISAARAAGGDALSAALSGAASAMASFTLEVFGQAAFPKSTADIAGKAVIWTRVGATSAASMRAWRKGYIQVKLADMAAQDRDPTTAEWDEVNVQAALRHDAIQAACP